MTKHTEPQLIDILTKWHYVIELRINNYTAFVNTVIKAQDLQD